MSPLPTVFRRLRRALGATLLLAAVTPGVVQAAGNPVIRDCTDDGRLSKTYSQKQYADALKNLPTDVDEYTDCRDVINRARLNSAGGSSSGGHGSSGSGGGGSTTSGPSGGGSGGGAGATPGTAQDALKAATPDEQAAVQAARQTGAGAPVQVGNQSVTPEDLSKTDLGSVSSIPTPLLIVLILLALASVSGAGGAILSRVRAQRRTPQA